VPGVIPYIKQGPSTYPTATTILGGKLVVPDGANPGMVKQNATAQAKNVLGIAANDVGVRTNQSGQNPVNMAQAPDYVAVHYGVDMQVLFSSTAAFGEFLVADAAGGVMSWSAATTPTVDQIIGKCTEPLGVAAGGTLARARIGSAL
jgi:hypothetical protein